MTTTKAVLQELGSCVEEQQILYQIKLMYYPTIRHYHIDSCSCFREVTSVFKMMI